MIKNTSDLGKLHRTRFLCSAHVPRQWPPDIGNEVAFAGRSNVGKSSAINVLTGQTRLAHTSKTPGRTQQIVFFEVAVNRRLVDLPGYGYAKVSAGLQKHWGKTVRDYLSNRVSLSGLILPVDIRRQLTILDHQLLDWCIESELTVHILLTKSDKLSRNAANKALYQVRQDIRSNTITVQLFSALRRVGLEDAGERVLALLRKSA